MRGHVLQTADLFAMNLHGSTFTWFPGPLIGGCRARSKRVASCRLQPKQQTAVRIPVKARPHISPRGSDWQYRFLRRSAYQRAREPGNARTSLICRNNVKRVIFLYRRRTTFSDWECPYRSELFARKVVGGRVHLVGADILNFDSFLT